MSGSESLRHCFLWVGSVIFGTTLVLLIYICPLLELTKILYFQMHSSAVMLSSPIIEYMYLALSIPLPVGLIWLGVLRRRCSVGIIRAKIIEELCFVPLYMIVISVGKVGDVALFCPARNYARLEVHNACVISTINFLAMWLYTILLVSSIFAYFCGCCPDERDFDLKTKFKYLSSVNLGSQDDKETLLSKA
ncbi:11519_t:CDS:2 [Dentiscutata heterogama]|uniref:11519_t:CDS:1 n=1 Tax=Dentiscutata heterogama TaxID=1316150 RepID=A0ACA9K3E8_9GLOM|nr:11519_t:CDS:2 [Dentiscutata heterogama]